MESGGRRVGDHFKRLKEVLNARGSLGKRDTYWTQTVFQARHYTGYFTPSPIDDYMKMGTQGPTEDQ